jgi:hypothetical protein
MNKVLMFLLFGAFILTGTSYAQTPPPAEAPAVAAPATVKPAHHAQGEHHPELHKALRKLKAAKEDLEKASHDYGGHRVKAIAAVDAAIEEVKAALEFDKK